MKIRDFKEKIKDLPDDTDLFIIINQRENNEIDSVELEAVHYESEDVIDFTRPLLKYNSSGWVFFRNVEKDDN